MKRLVSSPSWWYPVTAQIPKLRAIAEIIMRLFKVKRQKGTVENPTTTHEAIQISLLKGGGSPLTI
jgi:hypothetical protein